MLALLFAAMPAWGAGDPQVENLALCRESWLDWKNSDPSKLESFSAFVRSGFARERNNAYYTPKSATIVDGLKVNQVFPGSLGLGLGFSVLVDASFDVAKQAVELDFGMPFRDCEINDGMRTCELPIAEQRTVMLASGDQYTDKTTLVGCYYFYEK
jgi:hypothetical protein